MCSLKRGTMSNGLSCQVMEEQHGQMLPEMSLEKNLNRKLCMRQARNRLFRSLKMSVRQAKFTVLEKNFLISYPFYNRPNSERAFELATDVACFYNKLVIEYRSRE